eukprot:tig00021494_g21931.t1
MARRPGPRHALADPEGRLWPGKDYYNVQFGYIMNARADEDFLDRSRVPRQPWHDWSAPPRPAPPAPPAPPRPACDRLGSGRSGVMIWNAARASRQRRRAGFPIVVPLPPELALPGARPPGSCTVQTLPEWAGGTGSRPERSIHAAYIAAIAAARHFIYMENAVRPPAPPARTARPAKFERCEIRAGGQYFITCCEAEGWPEEPGGPANHLWNRVGAALFERLCLAVERNEPFKLYLVLPETPDKGAHGPDMEISLHWQHKSLGRGAGSLLGRLRARFPGIDPDRPAPPRPRPAAPLRGGRAGGGRFVSVLIVDDALAIVGTPNITERSLTGRQDSEARPAPPRPASGALRRADADAVGTQSAVVVEDGARVASVLAGRPVAAARFAHSLRCALWREHFGLPLPGPAGGGRGLPPALLDAASDATFALWSSAARENTARFRALFPDIIATKADPGRGRGHAQAGEDGEGTADAHGPACPSHLYPLEFLEREVLGVEPGDGLLAQAADATRLPRARRRLLYHASAPFL